MKKSSWKTTVCGVAGIVIAICVILKALFDGDPNTRVDFGVLMNALSSAGIGGTLAAFFSRDDDKTSEDVGAK